MRELKAIKLAEKRLTNKIRATLKDVAQNWRDLCFCPMKSILIQRHTAKTILCLRFVVFLMATSPFER